MSAAITKQPTVPVERRWMILIVVATAQLMVVLDATIVNIALPSAQKDLGFPNSDRQWVVTAYALAFGSLLLVGGRIGDIFSRKRVFITGLVGFAVSSALGGAATSFGTLVTARTLQGAFGADPRTVCPGHPRQHVPGSTRARAGVRGLRLGRGRRWRRGPDPRRRPHRVSVLAVDPLRQPALRRDRGRRRPGLHPRQPARRATTDGLARRRAGVLRPVPGGLRLLPRRDRWLDRCADSGQSRARRGAAGRVRSRRTAGEPSVAAAAGRARSHPGRLLRRDSAWPASRSSASSCS